MAALQCTTVHHTIGEQFGSYKTNNERQTHANHKRVFAGVAVTGRSVAGGGGVLELISTNIKEVTV
jgi:hypothetical protein